MGIIVNAGQNHTCDVPKERHYQVYDTYVSTCELGAGQDYRWMNVCYTLDNSLHLVRRSDLWHVLQCYLWRVCDRFVMSFQKIDVKVPDD